MKLLLEFENSHHYFVEFVKTDYFCPMCGKTEVWRNSDGGDYYEGSMHLCASCDAISYLDSCSSEIDIPYKRLINQIKSGTVPTPTTKKG